MGGIGKIFEISEARDIGSDAIERSDDTIGGFWLRFANMEIVGGSNGEIWDFSDKGKIDRSWSKLVLAGFLRMSVWFIRVAF